MKEHERPASALNSVIHLQSMHCGIAGFRFCVALRDCNGSSCKHKNNSCECFSHWALSWIGTFEVLDLELLQLPVRTSRVDRNPIHLPRLPHVVRECLF